MLLSDFQFPQSVKLIIGLLPSSSLSSRSPSILCFTCLLSPTSVSLFLPRCGPTEGLGDHPVQHGRWRPNLHSLPASHYSCTQHPTQNSNLPATGASPGPGPKTSPYPGPVQLFTLLYVLQVLAGGAQIRPGMTVIRTPIQQTGPMGKTILRTPLVVQQGNVFIIILLYKLNLFNATCNLFAKTLLLKNCYQNFESVSEVVAPASPPPPSGQGGQQVVTQIIRGQAVSTAGGASPAAGAGAPRLQGQGQVKLTVAQLGQLTQVSQSLMTHKLLASKLFTLKK